MVSPACGVHASQSMSIAYYNYCHGIIAIIYYLTRLWSAVVSFLSLLNLSSHDWNWNQLYIMYNYVVAASASSWASGGEYSWSASI